jgi:uncharacterized membrane protein YgcG
MRSLDFSSWQGIFSTLMSLAVFTLLGVGVRMLMMQTIQQRRERMNRQINERLRTLIAAYKVLGGSFTGQLTVDPTHLRELRAASPVSPASAPAEAPAQNVAQDAVADARMNSDRARRIRDAVEAALADILLLGTEEHCRLAGQAASDMAAGRPIHTAELVVSLRNFVREALDLDPMPSDVSIPLQGPTRTQGSGGGRGAGGKGGDGGGGKGGGGGGGGGGGEGGGMGMGMGVGLGHAAGEHDHTS